MEVLLVIVLIVAAAAVWFTRRGKAATSEAATVPRRQPSRQHNADDEDYSSPDEPEGRVPLSRDGRVKVAGTSYRQATLRQAAGGRVVPEGDLEGAIPVEATLVPEPRNPHGRGHAVRVDVNGSKVGYLPSEEAGRYRPNLDELWRRQGALGTCPGFIMGGGDRRYGMWLRLGPPDRLVFANPADGLDMVDADRMVTVTKLKDHQDVLGEELSLVPQDGLVYQPVVCELVEGTVASGKYAGQRCLEVRLNGRRIGELSRKMSDRYGHLLVDGRRVGCEAFARRTEKGVDVKLRLPEVDDEAGPDG